MRTYLLDINILVSIGWHRDESHELTLDWFKRIGVHSFATCALTQTSWIRLLTNPAFPGGKTSVGEAQEALNLFTNLDGHIFWPKAPDFAHVVQPFAERVLGHRQITDAYLLGLAILNRGALVTRDKAIPHLAGAEFQKHVVLL